jgi:hypothetical protein
LTFSILVCCISFTVGCFPVFFDINAANANLSSSNSAHSIPFEGVPPASPPAAPPGDEAPPSAATSIKSGVTVTVVKGAPPGDAGPERAAERATKKAAGLVVPGTVLAGVDIPAVASKETADAPKQQQKQQQK